ncbi:MAG: hypothetical protein IIC18_09330 [Bacteroidetes bacterium]|nr:hypothetical protein [Bacteroidota bacterium]
MNNRLTTLLMVCSLALALTPISIQAQEDGPPTIMMSSAQCDRNTLDDLLDNGRERALPIWQDLVNEGMIESHGTLRHWWGDEWNLVSVMVAADVAAVVAANAEFGSRFNDLYPDDDTYITNCPRHRDVFYQGISRTTYGDADDEDNGDGNAFAISYFECDYTQFGEIAEQDREGNDVYQGLVDEGMLSFHATASHTWGNEWNYISVASADDIPALLAGLAEANSRFEEAYPDEESVLDAACTAHKDNIYSQVMWTVDPEGD